eukprot:jgi/Picsp_1/6686/NSC_04029-R1_---NA---
MGPCSPDAMAKLMSWKDKKISRLVEHAREARAERDTLKFQLLCLTGGDAGKQRKSGDLDMKDEDNTSTYNDSEHIPSVDGDETIPASWHSGTCREEGDGPKAGTPCAQQVHPDTFRSTYRASGTVSSDEDGTTVWRRKAEMALGQLKNLQARASAAEGNARLFEGQRDSLRADRDAIEDELLSYRKKYALLQNEYSVCKTERDMLRHKEEQLAQSMAAAQESDRQSRERQEALAEEEGPVGIAALTEQARILGMHLQQAKEETASAKEEVALLKGQQAERERVGDTSCATLMAANRQLENALENALSEVVEKKAYIKDIKEKMNRILDENKTLQEAKSHLEDVAYQSEVTCATFQTEVDELRQRMAGLEEQLADGQDRIDHYENQARERTRHEWEEDEEPESSPLQDATPSGSLRHELAQREEQIGSLQEELLEEKRTVRSLHEQVLNQVMEMENLRRESMRAKTLHQELSALTREHGTLQQEYASLKQKYDAISNSRHIKDLQNEIYQLRQDNAEKEDAIMQLQGRVKMVGSHMEDNWLTG